MKTKYEEDTKKFNEISKFAVRCKCSHTTVLARVDRAICSHCGRWVYRTPQLKFKYKMKECLIKEERNDN
jgi:hypothetical protein